MVLADAWKGLAGTTRRSDNSNVTMEEDCNAASADAFTKGALVSYKGALDIASTAASKNKGRIVLRAKERRRIEKAMSALG